MKKLITIAFVLISLVSCKKENVNPNAKGAIDVEWRVMQGSYIYEKVGGLVKFSANNREYEKQVGAKNWTDIGTYSFNDTLFSHTTKTGYTYTALYRLSPTKDTLEFRDLNYRFNYPNGGEPFGMFVKNR